MKNKVTTHQNKEERIEKIELVSYRSNTGKGKGRIWERSYFEEIQVKFYQLFAASVIRWSLENLRKKVYKNIVGLTRERKEGRKKEVQIKLEFSCAQDNKQTNQQNWKTTARFKRARRKKLKFWISCKSVHKQRNGSRFSENPWVKYAEYASSCAVIGRKNKFAKRKETRFSRNRSTASEWAHR